MSLPVRSGQSTQHSGLPACSQSDSTVSCGGNGEELPWEFWLGGMSSHLQTTKRSAHWWSQESQCSFLMHSPRQPPTHSTLSLCPRWDPADPAELHNLGYRTQTCYLEAAALAASALHHSGPLVAFLVLHPCLLSKSHSNLVLLKVWSAECPQDDHKGEY